MKKVLLILAVAGLLIGAISSQGYALIWSSNLLTNPGAEAGNLSGWTSAGPMYATTSQSQSTVTVYPYSGDYFFSAALDEGSLATLSQTVDVTAYASAVDAGLVLYDVGFWYQTEHFDTAEGSISFYDASSNLLGFHFSDPLLSSTWAYFNPTNNNVDFIPAETRSIELGLKGVLHTGSYINAFFDDAHLKVAVTPEPASLILFGIGTLGFGVFKRRKR